MAQQRHTLPGYAFIHDFAVCDGSYVVFRNPVSLALLPLIAGVRSCVQCISFHPDQPLEIHFVPRPATSASADAERVCTAPAHAAHPGRHTSAATASADTDRAARLGQCTAQQDNSQQPALIARTEAQFVFHHANAYREGGSIVVDSICYSQYPDFFKVDLA